RGADHHARKCRRVADGGRRASLPRPSRRHGVERACLRSRQQHAVRSRYRLVWHLQQGAQGPAIRARHALLRWRRRVRSAREVEGLAHRAHASTGKERWKYASPTPLIAGVTATSGGVLFTGDLNNDFLALDANTGQVLYRFNTGGSIGGGVISYA